MDIFVYGTLKRGFHNHYLLKDATFVGEDRTLPLFTMLKLGGFPGVIPGGQTAITGEIWRVDDKTLRNLDRLEQHPKWYQRTGLLTEGGKAVEIYLLPKDYNDDGEYEVVNDGTWK